ncbi:MAG: DUF3293 domain-containing protein [Rhodospirillaceae bacterium]
MSVPSDLVAAYRAAVYEVDDGEGVVRFHVEEPSAALDGLLARRGACSAVLITAYNPRSRKQSAAENTDAHRALLDAVAGLQKQYLPSRGRDPDGEWPAEPGLFIFDLAREQALALARRFQQYAVVWAEKGSPPVLVFAEPPARKTSR